MKALLVRSISQNRQSQCSSRSWSICSGDKHNKPKWNPLTALPDI